MLVKLGSRGLVVIGLLAMIVSLGADLVGIGSKGIQAAQILGALGGFFLILAGLWLGVKPVRADSATNYSQTLRELWNQHAIILLILAGFCAAFIWFFLIPTFFNDRLQFQYFYRYLPDEAGLGRDLKTIVGVVREWVLKGQSPYKDYLIYYPPLYVIVFAPLTLISHPEAFLLVTLIGLVSYLLTGLVLPLLHIPNKNLSITLFFFASGLFSYGVVFELERGQFNLLALLLCLAAVYLFHYHSEYRYFAYLFFSIAVQLKTFPLIFIVMLVRDWRDWKNNILRMLGLGLFNFALLFILGWKIFNEFVQSTLYQIDTPAALTWVGNHSIKAYVYNLAQGTLGTFPPGPTAWLNQNAGLLNNGLMLYFGICFLSILISAYLRRERGLNTCLLLVCTLGSLAIPAVSNDYKLSLLAAPMALAFGNLSLPGGTLKKVFFSILVLIGAFGYSATLFPFKYRPDLLANSLPLLMLILTSITLIYHLQDRPPSSPLQAE